jgi:hypothetical protein
MTKIATATEDVHIRANPHAKAKEVGVLKKGGKREVIGRDESVPGYLWLRVKEGWVYSKYVKVASNVPDYEPPHIPIPDTSLAKMFAWVVGIIAACSVLAYCVR